MGGALLYQTTDRGWTNPSGERHVVYYGTTYRIPASAHNTIQQLEWERNPTELCHDITLEDGTTLTPDPSGIVERTDTFDAETGDLLVTYRVPYVAKELTG